MITHDEIRDKFVGVFPKGPDELGDRDTDGVILVSRYKNPMLKLPRRRAHVFIPDCHLLSRRDAAQYPHYHFVLKEEIKRFLENLTELKANRRGELSVWQLGDLFDVWRALGGRDPKAEIDEITADFAETFELLRNAPPYGVRAEIMAGNHDYVLRDLAEWEAKRFFIIPNSNPTEGDVLVLHGDVFDWLERIAPDDLQEYVVQLARWVSTGRHELQHEQEDAVAEVNRHLPTGDKSLGASDPELLGDSQNSEDAFNVIDVDTGDKNAPNKRFFKQAGKLAAELEKHGHNIRVVVIGHSHWARLLAGNREDGKQLILMDCGAWFARCRLIRDADWIWSAQIGVLLDDDLRIYQMGWKKASS